MESELKTPKLLFFFKTVISKLRLIKQVLYLQSTVKVKILTNYLYIITDVTRRKNHFPGTK